jgi:hypothetical protein
LHVSRPGTRTRKRPETRRYATQARPLMLQSTSPAPPRPRTSSTSTGTHGLAACWSMGWSTRPKCSMHAASTARSQHGRAQLPAARQSAAAFAGVPHGTLCLKVKRCGAMIATRRSDMKLEASPTPLLAVDVHVPSSSSMLMYTCAVHDVGVHASSNSRCRFYLRSIMPTRPHLVS